MTNKVKITFLGGVGEIGKNMTAIEYNDEIIVIDAGLTFPGEDLPGVDIVIPDITYLKTNKDKVKAILLTHGHEDHIGALSFVLNQLNVPIYGSRLTLALVENKMKEFPNVKYKAISVKPKNVLKLGSFVIEFIKVSHSIAGSLALCVTTPVGNIFHTGDFKIDFTPVGPQAEYEKLARLGSEGVLCLAADSTNALVPGFTESEKKIGNSIKDLFKRIHSRIIVATFASNIYRVQQVIEASILTNRKVAVFGRSMEKTIEVGQQVGYIRCPKGTIIEPEDVQSYKPEEITLLCTGSQGENLAALSRIAGGTHKQIKLIPGDTIIFSSSPIPGNQEGVNKTINLLFKNGANVITHSPLADTHTSGHASQGELKLLQALLKPKYFIPVHGEYRMQRVHADLAIECGLKKENAFILENGDVFCINERGARLAGKVEAGDVYIDGTQIGDISSNIIRERKILSEDGLFALVITIDTNNKTLPLEPQVVSRGFIYMKDSEALTKHLVQMSKEFLIKEINKYKTINLNTLKYNLTDYLTKLIYDETDRKPMILPIFMVLDTEANN